jgi:hypothetical protein
VFCWLYLVGLVVFGNVAEEEEQCLQDQAVLVRYEEHHLLQDALSLFWTYFYFEEANILIKMKMNDFKTKQAVDGLLCVCFHTHITANRF